jgi:hypothetical protein
MAFGVESHGIWVHSWIVAEPPRISIMSASVSRHVELWSLDGLRVGCSLGHLEVEYACCSSHNLEEEMVMRYNGRYSRQDHRVFRNPVPIDLVFLHAQVRQRHRGDRTVRSISAKVPKSPRATYCQRCASFTTACMYGNLSLSALLGSLSLPTTRSSSSCAAFWTSGNSAMAMKNVMSDDTVVSAPPA